MPRADLRREIPLATRTTRLPRKQSDQAIGKLKRSRGEALYPGCDYSAEEVEFLQALDAYKRQYRRPHPTCCEVLAVLKSLGYRKAG